MPGVEVRGLLFHTFCVCLHHSHPLFPTHSLPAEQEKGKAEWEAGGIRAQEALVPLAGAGAMASSAAVPLLHTEPA